MNEHWEPVIPYVYRRGALIERDSGDCGRWVNFDPSVDWICEECSKYYKQKFEATQDGITWYDTGLRRKGNIYELESDDCCLYRWITLPISQSYRCDDCGEQPIGYKLIAEYFAEGESGTLSALCDSSSVLSSGDVETIGQMYITSAQIGDCITSIGNGAFSGCSNLSNVTIPNSVTSIGERSFLGCFDLKKINLPDNLTNIGNRAFSGCTSLTSISIPSGVTEIGDYALFFCVMLTDITINSLTPATIHPETFDTGSNCPIYVPCEALETYKNAWIWKNYRDRITCKSSVNTLAYVILDNGDIKEYKVNGTSIEDSFAAIYSENCVGLEITTACTSIGIGAFIGCSFSGVVIPDSVTTIGSSAFTNCENLKSVYIPSGVTEIKGDTFTNCNSLSSLTISEGVTSISNYAFNYCGGLTNITVETGNTVFDSRNNCNAIINTSTNTLVKGCKNTVIPNSVTSIGNSAFLGCTGLTEITIPSGVTSIGEVVFDHCNGLISITFESVTPPSLLGGQNYLFEDTNYCPIYVPCESISAYSNTFYSYKSQIKGYPATGITITPTAMTLYDGGSAYVYTNVIPNSACDKSVTFASFNPSVATVDDNGMVTALSVGTAKIIARNSNWIDTYCDVTVIPVHTTGVTLSDSTLELSIGESYSLSATVLPSNATYKSVTWETNDSSIATIDNSGSISAVSSGDAVITVTTTDGGFTAKCDVTVDSVVGKKIYYTATEKLNVPVDRFTPNAVDEKYVSSTSAGTIYFNEPVTALAQSFNGSKKITSIIIPDSVTIIGNYTFRDCSGLTSCTIGSGVTQIGSYAFGGCSSLTSIDLPDGVTIIGDSAFRGCSGITSINIPSGVTYIREDTFNNCISLSSCTIPDGATYIGSSAFYGCSSLTSITIPSGVTYIGYSAFQRCSGSTGDLDIPDNTTSIGYYAFWGCSGLTSVTIGSGITSIGQGAFYNCRGLESITINAITPPSFGSSVFTNTNNCPIYVPAQSVNNYKYYLSGYSSRIQAIQ